jgi:hypothetical protein
MVPPWSARPRNERAQNRAAQPAVGKDVRFWTSVRRRSDERPPRPAWHGPCVFDKGIQIRMGQAHVKRWIDQLMPLVTDDSDPLGVEDLATHHLPLAEAPAPGYDIFQKKTDDVEPCAPSAKLECGRVRYRDCLHRFG